MTTISTLSCPSQHHHHQVKMGHHHEEVSVNEQPVEVQWEKPDPNPMDATPKDHYSPSVRLLDIPKLSSGACGFNLSRSKWDPYPWVSGVDKESPAEDSGLKAGDCVLEVNHQDVLGMRVAQVANIVRLKPEKVSLLLWTSGSPPSSQCDPESLCCGPMPQSLEKLSAAMSTILAAMECPICFETIPPPVIQCQNGHLICATCRRRSERCPVCREKYSQGRSLIAEQIHTSLTDAFNLPNNEKLRERLFGGKFVRASDLKYINIQSLTQRSHTQKFLARLMGRSSSLENLSTIRKPQHLTVNDDKLSLSSKSQSTTEIFQADRPNGIQSGSITPIGNIRQPQSLECLQKVCRHPSSNSLVPNKETSFSSTSSSSSSLVSCENLSVSARKTSTGAQIAVPKLQHLTCLVDPQCAKMSGTELRRHINEHHQIPIIAFGGSSAQFRLPPVEPLDKPSFLLFRQGVHRHVWLRMHYDAEQLFCAAFVEGSPAVSKDECLGKTFSLETSIRTDTGNKELLDRCDIPPIEGGTSWDEVLEGKRGIFYTRESLRSTFDTENLLLTVKIVQKDV